MKITGAITALVTPMRQNGDIDYPSLESLIEMQIDNGISSIVAVGTTGESATIEVSEHIEVIEFFVKKINGRIPLIAGTGANATKEAVYLTNSAKDLGVDAVLLVTPYYNKPTQEGLYQHYMSIADAVEIPQILYNVPSRTAVHIESKTVSRLAQHQNITGLKDATGDMEIFEQLNELCALEIQNNTFCLYSGDDETSYEFIKRGGHGTISVTSNLLPALVSSMYQNAKDKNPEAKKINEYLSGINRALFIQSNPIPVKYALFKMGLIEKGIRLPLTTLSEKHFDVLNNELQKLDLI
ncbi:MAG: 4-hydroxy-tetrahydrodipicolinate synthase [Gammaproteobacteria bacterium]|jgi:4-hydroxy-tetrahydrodipicolinate synthase|nr:4-hydroxy-tetrahydrodipicolinate synthase [Gammaproteobacteria bacterium]|tara:strand:+ start:707 stop:1597 length:891 start_codon:yes stop_codon:yes gene_type:complete